MIPHASTKQNDMHTQMDQINVCQYKLFRPKLGV